MSRTMSLGPLARAALGLLLLAASAAPLAAGVNRWTRIGPYGGTVTELAPAPSRPGLIYAHLAPGGIFRSADVGQTWSLAGSGLVDTYIFFIAVHPRRPTTVYAGTDRGLLRTTDGGTTWTPVAAGVIGVFAIDPRSPQVLWGAGLDRELLKSSDGGATWGRGEGWPDHVLSLALDPVRAQRAYVASYDDREVFRTDDGGATWKRIDSGLPAGFAARYVTVDPRRPQRVFLAGGTSGAGFFRSDDGGLTWKAIRGFGLDIIDTIAFAPAGDTVYATTHFEGTERVWKSEDGGLVWRPLFTLPKGASAAPRPLLATAFGLLVGTGGHGVLASSDRGASWRPVNEGLSAHSVEGLAVAAQSPPRLYVNAFAAGLFKSADRGEHWLRLETELGIPGFRLPGRIEIDPHDPLRVYATFSRGFAWSHNGGRRWQPYVMSCFFPTALALDPVTPGAFYLAGALSSGCAQQPDACWNVRITPAGATCLGHPPIAPQIIYELVVDPHAPEHLLAVAAGKLYGSFDGGGSWTLLVSPAPNPVLFAPVQPGVVYGAFDGAVGRSVDGGATWELAREGIPLGAFIRSLALDPSDPAVLYAATVREGVFRSADSGRTWTEVAPGLEGLQVWKVRVDPEDPSILYAGTYGASVLSVDQEP